MQLFPTTTASYIPPSELDQLLEGPKSSVWVLWLTETYWN